MDDVTIYDIEATDLNANKGRLISMSWKRRGDKKVQTISQLDVQETVKTPWGPIVDGSDDSKLAKAIREVLDKPSILVSWYGKGYDRKYLNTRFAAAGTRPFPPVAEVDLYWTARFKYKFTSNSLGSVAEFFKVPYKKTHLDWDIWIAAGAGKEKAIKYIVEHDRYDALITECLYEKMKGDVFGHPRLGPKSCCASCGLPMQVDKHKPATHYMTERIQLYCPRCRRYETHRVLRDGSIA